MHKGDVVEAGRAEDVLGNPTHEYSRALRSAVLPPDPVVASAIIREKLRAL
jgi:peptide/nickel transport system ATP-binding protein